MFLSLVLVSVSYVFVFTQVNGTTPPYAATSIGFQFPKVFWGVNMAGRTWQKQALTLALALFPVVSIFCGLFALARRSLRKEKIQPVLILNLAILCSAFVMTLAALSFKGAYNLNHYFVGTAALFSSLPLLGTVGYPKISGRVALIALVLVGSMSYLLMQMKMDGTIGLLSTRSLTTIAVLVLLVFIALSCFGKLQFIGALVWTVFMFNFANTIGTTWNEMRWTGYDLYTPAETSLNLDLLRDLTDYMDSLESDSVVAIDPKLRDSDLGSLLAAGAPIQFWAGRYNLEDTKEFRRRVNLQTSVTTTPTLQVIAEVKRDFVSHVVLWSSEAKLSWQKFLDKNHTLPVAKQAPLKVFDDGTFVVYEL